MARGGSEISKREFASPCLLIEAVHSPTLPELTFVIAKSFFFCVARSPSYSSSMCNRRNQQCQHDDKCKNAQGILGRSCHGPMT
eukprot:scaffold1075_cov104-Cylindrotheca_fusiformis.AAC.4